MVAPPALRDRRVAPTGVQLLLQCVQVLLQGDLHPDQAGAGHHAGHKDDESAQREADAAALCVASSKGEHTRRHTHTQSEIFTHRDT